MADKPRLVVDNNDDPNLWLWRGKPPGLDAAKVPRRRVNWWRRTAIALCAVNIILIALKVADLLFYGSSSPTIPIQELATPLPLHEQTAPVDPTASSLSMDRWYAQRTEPPQKPRRLRRTATQRPRRAPAVEPKPSFGCPPSVCLPGLKGPLE